MAEIARPAMPSVRRCTVVHPGSTRPLRMTKAVTGTTGRPRRKRSRRSSVNGGDDLRHCAIEDRKALLRDLVGAAGCTRVVYVGHVRGIGRELFEAVRQVGGEGIVGKRQGSTYRAGEGHTQWQGEVSETTSLASIHARFSELGRSNWLCNHLCVGFLECNAMITTVARIPEVLSNRRKSCFDLFVD